MTESQTFECANCNDRYLITRKTKSGYEELVNGEWTVTPACEERAKREREAREKVRKAAESIKQKPALKKDGRRRA